jgi:hypothetical protein
VVLNGDLPLPIQKAAEMYAGCVSGAIPKAQYLQIINDTGFLNVRIDKEKQVTIPDDILLNYLSASELVSFKNSGVGIYSINVYAQKPGKECGPECGCK